MRISMQSIQSLQLTDEVLEGLDLLLEDMVLDVIVGRLIFLGSFLGRHSTGIPTLYVPSYPFISCALERSSGQETAVLMGLIASPWPLVLSVPQTDR
jgi:hypothetical protein